MINSSIKLKTNEFARPKLKRKQTDIMTKSKMNKSGKSDADDDENDSDQVDNDESDDDDDDDDDQEYAYDYENDENTTEFKYKEKKLENLFDSNEITNGANQQFSSNYGLVQTTSANKVNNVDTTSSPLSSIYYNSSGIATPMYKSSNSSVYSNSSSSSSSNSEQFLTLPTLNIASINNESSQLYAWMKDGRQSSNMSYLPSNTSTNNNNSHVSPHKLNQCQMSTLDNITVLSSGSASGSSPTNINNINNNSGSSNQNDSIISLPTTNGKTSLCDFFRFFLASSLKNKIR